MSLEKPISGLPVGVTPAVTDYFLFYRPGVSAALRTGRMLFGELLTLFGELNTGAWSGLTTYTAGQIVTSGGSAYQCVLGHLNQVPPNATYWRLLVSIGATGAAGSVVHFGDDVPASELGVDGDAYFRNTNSQWYSKAGGSWTPEGNSEGATGPAGADSEIVVHQSSVAGSTVTGTTETTIATVTIPVMGTNDAVFFAAVFTRGTANENTILRAYHAGVVIATHTVDISTFTSIPLQHLFSNRNNASVQLGGVNESFSLIEGAVNTALTSTLVFKVENGHASDTITLQSLTVKLVQP